MTCAFGADTTKIETITNPNNERPPMPRQNPILTALQRDLADAIEREKTAKHDVAAIREQLERFGRLVRKKPATPPKPTPTTGTGTRAEFLSDGKTTTTP